MLNNLFLLYCKSSRYFLNCVLRSEDTKKGRTKYKNLSDIEERRVGIELNMVQWESMQGMFVSSCSHLLLGENIWKRGKKGHVLKISCNCSSYKYPQHVICWVSLTIFHQWEHWGSENEPRSYNWQKAQLGREFISF